MPWCGSSLPRYRTKAEQLEAEEKVTDDALQPLHLQLLDLDEQLKESAAKSSALKAKISRNDSRIEQFLQAIVQL
jgi:CII-binding regulator of phage lambda lysogenization HflD